MKAFYDKLRASFGPLSQDQVDGINALLTATAGLPLMHRAYVLATAWHETARTMQPIHEYGQRAYFDKYEPYTSIGKALGNTVTGDGYKFRGRGYVQLTGRRNYQHASLAIGRDLVADPDRALEADTAAQIIVKGMSQGWFTGKKMGDYRNYVDMRKVVNGTDKASTIALYAEKFEAALLAIGDAVPLPPDIPKPVIPEFKPEVDHAPINFWQWLKSLFSKES